MNDLYVSTISIKKITLAVCICLLVFSLAGYLLFSSSSDSGESKSDIYAQPKTATVLLGPYGFEPKILEIQKGTTVTFTNKSTSAYWLASNPEYPLSGFGTDGIINPGQSYSFVYDTVGVWPYHEQAYEKFEGIVQVTE